MASKFWQNLRDKVSNITGDAPDEARFEDYEEVIGTHTEEKPKEEPQAEPAPEASISAVSETGGNINLKFVHPTSYDMEQVSEIAELLLDGAKESGIPYQLEAANIGGTDAGAIHLSGSGIASGTISIPTRYIHSSSEVIDKSDLENTVTLLEKIMEKDICEYLI